MMSARLGDWLREFPRRAIVAGLILAGLALPVAAQSAPAQAVAASPSSAAPTEAMRSVLGQVNEAVAGLNVSRWKAPGEVRGVTQRDIDSIQRDIGSTLPPLLDRANTPPASVAAYFAVYRNVDALYDVLLRVSETATLAGSQDDANTMQAALSSLEAARRSLGDAILSVADSHEQELVTLRATAAAQAAAAAAAPPPEKKTVVEDGPATPAKKATTAKRKKPATSQTAAPPAAVPSAPPSNPQ
jgi:hypothetical protein